MLLSACDAFENHCGHYARSYGAELVLSGTSMTVKIASSAGGSGGADLTKAALEEASSLEAVVSWYRNVQRQQIDQGLAGDPVMFPLAQGAAKDPPGEKNRPQSIPPGGSAVTQSAVSGLSEKLDSADNTCRRANITTLQADGGKVQVS